MAANKKQPPVLVHFTSGRDGAKGLETEIVKPGSASALFLQRMEKHQANKPFYKSIDLREHTPSKIFEYEYQGIVHYLDSSSIELFENLLAKYESTYTQEIYNLVTANAQNQLQNSQTKKPKNLSPRLQKPSSNSNSVEDSIAEIPKAEKTVLTKKDPIKEPTTRNNRIANGSPIQIIPFGYHRHQNEVRMLYTSNIQIFTDVDESWGDAKTINISVSGLKIKLQQNSEFYEGQKLFIHFNSLNEKLGKPYPAINYEIVNIDFQQGYQILRLIRIENEEDLDFINNLANYISINRRRYKIDLDDFIESAKSKYLERLFSLNSQYPWIFFHFNNQKIKIKHLLSGNTTGSDNRLLHILTEMKAGFEFIESLSLEPHQKNSQSLLNIYSFTQQDKTGKEILYSAIDADFENDNEKNEFLRVAVASGSYLGWTLLINTCEVLSETASSSYFSEYEDISIEETNSLQAELETIIATARVIENTKLVQLQASKFTSLPADENYSIEKFICPIERYSNIINVKVAQKKQRNENRYFLTTSAEIEINGTNYFGHTLDFSPNGVKIQLENPLSAKNRDNADITFPGLQKKFKKEQLSKQHFRVANISRNGKTICFSRDRRFVLHEASIFFRKLIDSNLHKLTQCSGDTFMVVRSAILEHIQNHNLQSIPFFVSLINHSLKANKIAVNENPISLLWDFKAPNEYNFDSVFSSQLWNKIMAKASNNNKIEVLYDTEIYLYKNDKYQDWQTSLSDDYKSLGAQNKFIQKLSQAPYKKILYLTLTPAPPFDEKYILDEIHEIRDNSQNQSDSLQNSLKRIRAVGELVEVTDNYF